MELSVKKTKNILLCQKKKLAVPHIYFVKVLLQFFSYQRKPSCFFLRSRVSGTSGIEFPLYAT